MINFSLQLTAQSRITLDALLTWTLPAVIEVLNASGYAVGEATSEVTGERGSLRQYSVEPGPATFSVAADETDGGSVQFSLDGAKFGAVGTGLNHDAVLWMRLVTLGVKIGENYSVRPGVVDSNLPGVATSSL